MTRLRDFLVVATLIFATQTLSAQTPESANDKLTEAIEQFKSERYAEAVSTLNNVIELAQQAGPDALEVIQSAQKKLVQCYYYIGMTLSEDGRLDEALKHLGLAIELSELYNDNTTHQKANDQTSKIYITQADAAINRGNNPKAVELCQKSIAIDTDKELKSKAYFLLGTAYKNMGKKDMAIEAFQKVTPSKRLSTAKSQIKSLGKSK